jgi:hypothetical protein
MDLVLLFWLMGEPVMEIGPITGGPDACAAMEARVTAEIAAAGPGDLVQYGDAMVPLSELSVSCEPPPAASCPVPDDPPNLLI